MDTPIQKLALAMITELVRQRDASDSIDALDVFFDDGPKNVLLDGRVDMEALAAAVVRQIPWAMGSED